MRLGEKRKKKIQRQKSVWTLIASLVVSLLYGIVFSIIFLLANGYILPLLSTSWQHCEEGVPWVVSLGPVTLVFPHTNLLCDQLMFSFSVSPDGECL